MKVAAQTLNLHELASVQVVLQQPDTECSPSALQAGALHCAAMPDGKSPAHSLGWGS